MLKYERGIESRRPLVSITREKLVSAPYLSSHIFRLGSRVCRASRVRFCGFIFLSHSPPLVAATVSRQRSKMVDIMDVLPAEPVFHHAALTHRSYDNQGWVCACNAPTQSSAAALPPPPPSPALLWVQRENLRSDSRRTLTRESLVHYDLHVTPVLLTVLLERLRLPTPCRARACGH